MSLSDFVHGGLRLCSRLLLVCCTSACLLVPLPALAQSDADPSGSTGADSQSSSWPGSFDIRGMIEETIRPDAPPGGADVTGPAPGGANTAGQDGISAEGTLSLEAVLIDDGEPVAEDLVWRVFKRAMASDGAPELVEKIEAAQPRLTLAPGTYFVNAAYGRAYLTRRVTVLANGQARERFVLNAGGLRATVLMEGGLKPSPRTVAIDIFSDESDQSGQRQQIITGARPDEVIRLNSGIYHIESRIGRANAVVRAEVSVEAGKLSEVKIVHRAAPITFKLVTEPGGEAIAGTRWTIITETGNVVRESMGALPTHVLAPGNYTAIAQWQGQTFRTTFDVESGTGKDVEVLSIPDAGEAAPLSETPFPSGGGRG